MPTAERNQFDVEIFLPTGSSLDRTAAVADSLEHVLRNDSRVVSVASFKETSSPRFQTTYAPQMGDKNFAQFIVNTKDNKATEAVLKDYRMKYANAFSDAYVRFKQLSYSKEENSVEVRLSGSDWELLKKTANKLTQQMRQEQEAEEQQKEVYTKYYPTVSATGLSFKPTKEMVKAKVDVADIVPGSVVSQLPQDILAQLPGSVSLAFLNGGTLAGISAMQPVYVGGRIINANKMAKLGVEASKLKRRQSVNEVTLTAQQYYWNIVVLKENLRTTQEIHSMLSSLERDVTAALKAGVSLRNDLLQVQLKKNTIESSRLQVENGLSISKILLAQYVGLQDTAFDVRLIDDSVNPIAFPLSLKKDHAVAVTSTPEYQLLEKNIESSVLEEKLERGKYLPSVGVGAGYNYTRMMGANNGLGLVFASVSIPISDWWGGSHAIRRKKIAEQNAKELLEDSSEKLQINMQKEWNNLQVAYKQLDIARKSIEQSTENLRLNNTFYHAGTAKMTDVLDAQQAYQQSRNAFVEAYANLQMQIIAYKLSTNQL